MLFNFQGPFAVLTAGLYYIIPFRVCQHFFKTFLNRLVQIFVLFFQRRSHETALISYHTVLRLSTLFWKLFSGRQARPPFSFVVLSLAKQLSYNTTPFHLCQHFFTSFFDFFYFFFSCTTYGMFSNSHQLIMDSLFLFVCSKAIQ